ncbi:MAG: GAF domain-containing protein [Planctomycetota bacterium]|jgi:PAS domain S-box-containing protein
MLAIVRDITNRKEAEEALQHSEERYALAQRAANIGSWDWDITTDTLVWSEQIEPMFGFGRGEFSATYEAFMDRVHPDDRQHVSGSVNACVEAGKNYSIEHRIIWPDGTIRWISETGDVIRDKDGKAIRMLGIVQDITERKETEGALRLHETRLQTLLDLNKMTGASQEEILDFVREEVIKITQSEFAFIGFMNEDETIMKINSWSQEAMARCAVLDKPMHFPIAEAGLWGEVVRQRKTVVVNDYAAHLQKRDCPEGHVPIKRFLGVPVFEVNRIVAVAAVANKDKDYNEPDIRAITSMMNDMWRLIQRQQAQDQVKNLARFPSENPSPVLRISKDGVILYANEASGSLLAEWGCKVGQTAPESWCRTVSDVFASSSYQRVEAEHADRVFAFVVAPVPEADYVNLYGRDITERKGIAARQELAGRILERLNQKSARPDLIHDVIKLIKESTGFEAVGIRLGRRFSIFRSKWLPKRLC